MENEKTAVNMIVEELSRINRAAADFAEGTEEAKIKLGRDYRDRKENFDEELNDAAKARLDDLRSRLEAENKEKREAMIRENEEYLARLDKAFEENHSLWAEQIVKEVVSERL